MWIWDKICLLANLCIQIICRRISKILYMPAVYRAWIPMYGLTYLSLCYCFVAFFLDLNFYPVFVS